MKCEKPAELDADIMPLALRILAVEAAKPLQGFAT